MSDEYPSLHLVLDALQHERDAQRAHFEGLDNKAGIVLGFAGLLAALAPDIAGGYLIVGLLLAAVSGGAAVASFWPRGYPVLDAAELRTYGRADAVTTRLDLIDTLQLMDARASQLLERKARLLKVALGGLAAAALVFGLGILAIDSEGGPTDGRADPQATATP